MPDYPRSYRRKVEARRQARELMLEQRRERAKVEAKEAEKQRRREALAALARREASK